jgi:repressor LexA
MSSLTHRQRQVLEFIEEYQASRHRPPTQQEIADGLGIAHRVAVRDHLLALARKGAIAFAEGSARGIRLLARAEANPAARQLPLIGSIAAGQPLIAPENVEALLPVQADFFRPRASFLYRVRGDSMSGAQIADGDLVALHAQPEAQPGQIIAARIEDAATGDETITLKRYRPGRGAERGLVWLHSENPEYAPIRIDLATQRFQIEGLFVGLIRGGSEP